MPRSRQDNRRIKQQHRDWYFANSEWARCWPGLAQLAKWSGSFGRVDAQHNFRICWKPAASFLQEFSLGNSPGHRSEHEHTQELCLFEWCLREDAIVSRHPRQPIQIRIVDPPSRPQNEPNPSKMRAQAEPRIGLQNYTIIDSWKQEARDVNHSFEVIID